MTTPPDAAPNRGPNSLARRAQPRALIGIALLAILILAAIAGLFIPRARWNDMSSQPRLAPSAAHWLGTDDLGRDLALRTLSGAHLTLLAALGAVALAALIGSPLGLAAAYRRGWLDSIVMRAADLLLAFPTVLLALAIVAALGFSLANVALAVGIAYSPQFARVARASALSQRSLDYIAAAEALGCPAPQVIARHLLPNCLGPLVVLGTVSLATAVLEAAALSFLGLGAQPPWPEWGRMLKDAQATFQTHPHMMLGPGLGLAATALSVNLLGDALRDRLDVRATPRRAS